MRMHVPDRLARRSPVLNRHRQRRGSKYALEHPADAPHRQEQVGCFGGAQVAKTACAAGAGAGIGGIGGIGGGGCVRAERADERVAREDGLEVDEGVGVGGCVEDLNVFFW